MLRNRRSNHRMNRSKSNDSSNAITGNNLIVPGRLYGYNPFQIMASVSRHQCLIYEGSPSLMLRSIAEVARQKLKEGYRCVYLNSPPMVAGMKSYMAAAGADVGHEINRGSLVLSSDQNHLAKGAFDVDQMIRTLEFSIEQSVRDGYKGLWATGDMTWEFGPQQNFDKLIEYEWRLEELFRKGPHLSGICQYHKDTLPHEVLRLGLQSHQNLFVNETLSLVNPHYVPAKFSGAVVSINPSAIDETISQLSTHPGPH